MKPLFRWIQIEISSLCQASCVYCPHTVYRKLWKGRLLPMEIFDKVASLFPRTELVFIQGWGEPFLHPLFFEFVKRIKEQGSMVGTTTNGMLIDENTAKRVVDSGMDVISFSLAGSSDKNDEIRRGTSIKHILKVMEWIRNERERQRLLRPRIHVAYLLLKSMVSELKDLPRVVASAGAEAIVISTLSLIPSKSLSSEVFDSRSLLDECLVFLTHEREWMKKIDVKVEVKLTDSKIIFRSGSRCPERPVDSFFVGSNGQVSPCVFLNLPMRIIPSNINLLNFGSLSIGDPEKIWERPSYRLFREKFIKNRLPFTCANCSRLNRTYFSIPSEKP